MNSSVSRPWIGTGLAALGIVVLTLYPFRLEFPVRPDAICVLTCGDRWLPDVLGNVLLYLPLGLYLRRTGRRVPIVVLLCVAMSAAIETMQLWLPREPTIQDALSNGLGAVIGAWIGSPGGPRHRALRYAVVVTAFAVLLAWSARLAAWDPSLPVVWGDEPDGSRPWAGTVHQATWCTSSRAGGATCVPLNPSPSTPRSLVAASLEHQRFTVAAAVTTGVALQTGPARIVTSSRLSGRNFTLAQDGDGLVFRVRTRLLGLDGSRPTMRLPGVFASQVGQRVSITARYDRGRVALHAASATGVRNAMYEFGPWSAWLILPHKTVTAGAFHALNLATLAAIFCLGALFSRSARWPRTHLARALALSVTGAVTLWLIPVALGTAPATVGLWLAALVGYVLGNAVAAIARRAPPRTDGDAVVSETIG